MLTVHCFLLVSLCWDSATLRALRMDVAWKHLVLLHTPPHYLGMPQQGNTESSLHYMKVDTGIMKHLPRISQLHQH